MALSRTKCTSTKCPLKKTCCYLPIEKQGNLDKGVDIAFYSESPSKKDAESNRPFSDQSGELFRAIIDRLSNKYNFSYYISTLIKGKPHEDKIGAEAISCCSNIINHEIKKYKPKLIVAMGAIPHNFFHKKNKNSIYLEEGCVRKIKIGDITYPTISTLHPASIFRNDPCTAGFIYSGIEKGLVHVKKGIDLNIPNKYNSILVSKLRDVKVLLKRMMSTNAYVAVDTETENLHRTYQNRILSIQLCNDGVNGYVIPLAHFDSPFAPDEQKKIIKWLYTFFTSEKSKVKGYIYCNTKFDIHQCFRELKVVKYNAPIIDISINEFFLEENWARVSGNFPQDFGPFSLGTMSYKRGFTHYREDLDKSMRKTLTNRPLIEWKDYAGADVVSPYHIWQSQLKWARIQRYDKFELMAINYCSRLSRLLMYTEQCGLPVNQEQVRFLYNPRTSPLLKALDSVIDEFHQMDSVKEVIKRLRKTTIGTSKTLFGTPRFFDPGKPSHKEMLFFDILGLDPVSEDNGKNKKTKNGKEKKASLDKAFQNAYKDSVREVALLSEYGRIKKLQTSYVNNIYKFMNKTSGNPDFFTDDRVRPNFKPKAVTGRLSCADPNTQQRVARGDRADAILAMNETPHGRVFVKLDYSTFEVRGLAFISEDKAMVKTFKEAYKVHKEFRENPLCFAKEGYLMVKSDLLAKISNGDEKAHDELANIKKKFKENPVYFSEQALKVKIDFHMRSASLFYQVPVPKVSKAQRQGAKNFVFGSIYGRSVQSIAAVLGIDVKEAEKIHKLFMSAMPGANNWLSGIKKHGQEHYYVESPIGRRRRLWGHFLGTKGVIGRMDRLAMNSVIQGFCSDLNIIAGDTLIDYFLEEGKAKTQVPDQEAWMLDNLVHDSCEMECPTIDLVAFTLRSEPFFTTRLRKLIKEEFGYNICIPIEVDYEMSLSYAKATKWNGSHDHLKQIYKTMLNADMKRQGKKDLTDKKIDQLFDLSLTKIPSLEGITL